MVATFPDRIVPLPPADICATIREVLGPPWLKDRLPNPFPDLPSWLAWRQGTVPGLAGAAYQQRDWGLLPVLADALEEAGCLQPDLLHHLRAPACHARGCWVLDSLREKE